MWTILGIIGFSAFVAVLEIPKLLRENKRNEIWMFSIILAIATTLSVLQAQDVHVPNPLIGIQSIYEPVGEFIINKYAP